MLKKCEYCDSYYDDTLPECPNCGAINKNVRRTNNETPHTIEELQAFFAAKHIDEEIKSDFSLERMSASRNASAFTRMKMGTLLYIKTSLTEPGQ